MAQADYDISEQKTCAMRHERRLQSPSHHFV